MNIPAIHNTKTTTMTSRTPKTGRTDVETAPPIVHALGGSIGSALALLLFYPLERARIEMQCRAALSQQVVSLSSASSSSTSCDDENLQTPVKIDDNSDAMLSEEGSSWASPVADSTPSSWSTTSSSLSTPRRSQQNDDDDDDDDDDNNSNNTNSIFRCLIELHDRGVLYQGVAPIISTIFTSVMGRISSSSSSLTTSSPWSSLLSSCLAGIGNVLCTNPLWVTNMAIVSGKTETQNLFHELIRLWKTHGAAHLWKGTNASMMLVSNPIIQFVCYEQLKRNMLSSKMNRQTGMKSSTTLGAADAFVIAAAAKAIATVITYPLQLTQTLLRLSSNNSISNNNDDEDNCVDEEQHHTKHQHQRRQQYKGTVDCLIQLYKSNDAGIAAWFTGMRAKLLQTVLTAAFTFLTYEQILGVIHRAWIMRKRQRQIEQ